MTIFKSGSCSKSTSTFECFPWFHPSFTAGCTQETSVQDLLSRTPCEMKPVSHRETQAKETPGHGGRKTFVILVLWFSQPCLSTAFQHFSSQCLSGRKAISPHFAVGELRCRKTVSGVFPMQRKASCNSQENFDKALQPSNISSVLATLMTSFLFSVSSSSQGRHLHFAAAPDAGLSANPSAGVVRIGGQRSSHLAS